MTEKIRELLQQITPADYWKRGYAEDSDNAKCQGCGLYVHDWHFIFCDACKEHLCIWCIDAGHRTHNSLYWSITSEPVDFVTLSKCTRASCGHFAIMHD